MTSTYLTWEAIYETGTSSLFRLCDDEFSVRHQFNKKHQKGYCLQSSPFTICVKSDQFSTLKARISRIEALNHAIFFNA